MVTATALHLGLTPHNCAVLAQASSAQNATGLGSQAEVRDLETTRAVIASTPNRANVWLSVTVGMVYPALTQPRVTMSKPGPLSDPMSLRDALRGLRHAVRRGGESFLDAMPINALPRPAADLAGVVLREVGEIAKGVNEMASGLARFALGGSDKPQGSLHALSTALGAEDAFARGVYAALRCVLRRLNAPSVYISETAARSAYLASVPDPGQGPDARFAATLSLALTGAKVLRGLSAADASQVVGNGLENTAIFAVMLWLQSARDDTDDEAALQSATDLAVALAPEVDAAFRARDVLRLETLYAEFAARV